jgi:hypothetical protein
MSNRNPMQPRAGNRARFNVSKPVRRGFFKYVARLHDRLAPSWNGIEFKTITSRRAQLGAWRHASFIVNREADHGFDYSVS